MSNESHARETVFPFTEDNLHALFWVGDQIPGGFFVYCADEDQELVLVVNEHIPVRGRETTA